jgi:heavy metal sensor kinase
MSSKRPRSVFFHRARFKLTLYYTATQLVFLTILGVFLNYRYNVSLLTELRKFIRDDISSLLSPLWENPNDCASIQRQLDYESPRQSQDQDYAERRGERYYKLSYRILNGVGKEAAASPVFKEYEIKIGEDTFHDALDGESIEEFLKLPDKELPTRAVRHVLVTRSYPHPAKPEERFVVQALASLEPLDKLSRRFMGNILSAIPIFVVISWFGGYALARKVLKPVNQIARTARQITSARLNERLARSHSGDEFDMLADTLNDMIHRLEESFALLRQFAADAAHEIRTPLTIVKGEAEIALRSKTQDPDAYRAVLASTIRECDRMIGIITSLLMLSQADTGAIRLGREPVRLDELLAEMAETFQVLAEEAGLSLTMAPAPEIVVHGDRTRLHELFANLLDNAVKYTPQGSVNVSCTVGPEEVRVAIADTGIGIAEGEQEKIFERFYRVDHSRSRDTGGSGLGLSIARWIAAAHGGRIEVQSTVGVGSTFTAVLPLAKTTPLGGTVEGPAG